MKRHIILYLLTIIISGALIFLGSRVTIKNVVLPSMTNDIETERAEVITVTGREVIDYEMSGDDQMQQEIITFRAKIIGGPNRGKIVTAIQDLNDFTAIKLKAVEPGDRIILYSGITIMDTSYVLGDYLRTDVLIVLCIVFFLLIILFGRRKGLNTIVSLVFTCLAVFAVFIPSIFAGYNIYRWSIATCIFIIIMTLLIVNGGNRKTLAAILGCSGGVLVAGLLTIIMSGLLNLSGYLDNESVYLVYLNSENPIDLKAIIFAAIIIGAMGAIMDVAMSIASSLQEINEQAKTSTFSSLFKSGLTIGRDIMGTMANTLILAYIGSSLSVVLVLIAYNTSLMGLLNREMIAVEILQALVGSIGILSAIPLTAFVSGLLYTNDIVFTVNSGEE